MTRAIEHAYNLETGERISISENTNSQKERFELRKNVQLGEVNLECIECGQKLNVSTSKNDIFYFKHMPKSNECLLKNASKEEIIFFNNHYASKESPRHKELKNAIGNKLEVIKGFSNVQIDNKFIITEEEKRKPDVYCKYGDVEIVFEIQLSNLSVKYLTLRHNFYKKNGIYLIWILDKFDPDKNTQLIRDVKYLNQYQNFFKLDEKSDEFRLNCKYKVSWITPFFEVRDNWKEDSFNINQLSFDNESYQVYYSDYSTNRNELETKAQGLIEEKKEIKKKEKEKQRKLEANKVADYIIDRIKSTKDNNKLYFDSISREISKLSTFELQILNDKLDISNKPSISKWLLKAQNSGFVLFILKCRLIDLNVNLGFEEKSTYQILLKNPLLFHDSIMKEMLKRCYILTDEDKRVDVNNNQLVIYQIAERLDESSDIDKLFDPKIIKLIFIIESIKQNKIINSGFKADDWIGFGNNLAQHYNDYWEYLENALRHYGIWRKIIELDRSTTFQNKVDLLRFNFPKQKTDFKILFDKIYPELK